MKKMITFCPHKQANPHLNWHIKFQAISHSYLETKVKNGLWRAIVGKLYLGDIALKYLQSRNNPNASKYEYCPYCPSSSLKKSTIQHQLWECPCIQNFWKHIHNLFIQLNMPFPLTSFNDIITFFQIGRHNGP